MWICSKEHEPRFEREMANGHLHEYTQKCIYMINRENTIWTSTREGACRTIKRKHAFAKLNLNAHRLDDTCQCVFDRWSARVFAWRKTKSHAHSSKHMIIRAQKPDSVHPFNKHVNVPSFDKTRMCIQTIKRQWAVARWNAKVHSRNKTRAWIRSINPEREFARKNANADSHEK